MTPVAPGSPPAGRTVTRAPEVWVAAGLVVLAALGWAAVILTPDALGGSAPGACLARAQLEQAMAGTSVADQAVVRARAAALADALQRDATSASQAQADRIMSLLARPYATTTELRAAIATPKRTCPQT